MKTTEELEAKLEVVTRERDEARAEVERLRELLDENAYERGLLARRMTEAQTRRNEARSEVERLTDERDELLVRVADQDAELRATREVYGDAFRFGAEAMREASLKVLQVERASWNPEGHTAALLFRLSDTISALPIPEEP